ncbi:hypothetical protein BJX96DRAFT_184690 [Aspergillus floccosus]
MNSGNKRTKVSDDNIASKTTRTNTTAAAQPRLTQACAECKKHKIKCFVQPGQTACNKCRRLGVQCVPYNFAQRFLDEDAVWKAQTAAKIEHLNNAVNTLLRHNNLPGLANLDDILSASQSPSGEESASGDFTPEGPSVGLRGPHDDSDLVPLPMNNLYNLTDPNKSQLIRVDPAEVNGPDFISQGLLPVAEAEFLFDHYQRFINPLLWDGMLCPHKSLHEARQSSPLLVAVVLTVAALHIPNREQSLHVTYNALSWALCSRGVRVATEMNLHKSSLQFARGSLDSYELVRLWYVLYVCDHQFALAYGRPPMMHEDAAVRNAGKLLTSGLCSPGDHGLVAQVKLFRILASGYFMHGCDPDLELSGADFQRLKEFDVSVDQWHLDHQNKEVGSLRTSLILPVVNTLYYHLARFQLNSIALRGISAKGAPQGSIPSATMSWHRQEASNIAIRAAMSTARLIIDDRDLQKVLIWLPIFTHAMVAVCALFLLKMAVVFGIPHSTNHGILHLPKTLAEYGLNFHTQTALSYVGQLVRVLAQVADNGSQRHVERQVATGLRELLQRFSPSQDDSFVYGLRDQPQQSLSAGSTELNRQVQRHNGVIDHPYHNLPRNDECGRIQYGNVLMEDPFDLTGDLDWRFNDGFLFGMEMTDSDLQFL